MRSLSLAQKNTILTMLNAGHSAHSIASITGVHASTMFRLCSKEHSRLQKSFGGCPKTLSLVNIHHAVYLIALWKVENAVQVIKTLNNITNQSLSTSTAHLHVKKAGMKAVVKSKHPFLCQASQGLLRLCSYPQGLDCG
jgi:hypothetical protein